MKKFIFYGGIALGVFVPFCISTYVYLQALTN